MEQPQNIKTISVVIIILLVLAIGYVLFSNYQGSGQGDSSTNTNETPITAVVEDTPTVNGVTPAPAGFPEDIPLEKDNILESAVTHYPDQGASQLSISYESSQTIAQKYAEYKNYMTASGYEITEGDTNSSVRAIFGTKTNVNLSVAISSSSGQTLVQLSYLLKSGQ